MPSSQHNRKKNRWDEVDLESEQIMDDALLKDVYLYTDNASSKSSWSGKPLMNPIRTKKEKANARNSGKFR